MTSPAPFIDHTLLRPETTGAQIDELCEEAVEHGFAAVCVPPVFVGRAASRLYGSGVAAATVVGFPLGYALSQVKAYEAARALDDGATEIDMVIHLGAALEGRLDRVEGEIREVVRACEGAVVKVILECSALDDRLKEAIALRAVEAGAAFLKTSTGFGAGGATVDDVRLLARAAAGRAGVKASGGIRDLTFVRELVAAGATRIGTSAGVRLVEQWRLEAGK